MADLRLLDTIRVPEAKHPSFYTVFSRSFSKKHTSRRVQTLPRREARHVHDLMKQIYGQWCFPGHTGPYAVWSLSKIGGTVMAFKISQAIRAHLTCSLLFIINGPKFYKTDIRPLSKIWFKVFCSADPTKTKKRAVKNK